MKQEEYNQNFVADMGDTVLCDICNEDYTESDEPGLGAFLFVGKAVCPHCAGRVMTTIRQYGEQKMISEVCPPGITFKQWVLDLRGGDNTINILSI